MNADEFIERVMEKANQCKGGKSYDPIPTACWFICVHEARSLLDAWRVKDIAREINAGMVYGPINEREHIENWLETVGEDNDWEWLEDALNRHFGLER